MIPNQSVPASRATRSPRRFLLPAIAPVLALAATACSPLAVLNVTKSTEGLTVTRDVAYGAEARQKLDIYSPEDAGGEAGKGRTVVVFFYGGSWREGRRADYLFVAKALADAGHVAVVPDYRLHPDVRFPAFVEDGAGALAWVRANIAGHGGDPDRIVLMGHSAGAHIALMLALAPGYLADAGVPHEALRGAIGLAGPSAFDPEDLGRRGPVFEGHVPIAEVVPITFAGRTGADGPPLLLLHGAADRTVGAEQSTRLAEAYRAAGGDGRVTTYDGVGHIGILLSIAGPPFRVAPVMRDSLAFIAEVASGEPR